MHGRIKVKLADKINAEWQNETQQTNVILF